MSHNSDTQLEWFDLPPQAAAATRNRQAWRVVEPLRVRADHAMLGLILTLVAGSVVFAVGIERGKHVARAERWAESPQHAATSMEPAVPASKMAPAVERKSLPPAPSNVSKPSPSTPAPKAVPGMRKPAKSVASADATDSKFAIQVVSYSQPQLAQRELQRLQQRGEHAFLVVIKDRTVLMVGPYGSRDRATAKLSSLKQQYQDCFVRTL